MAKRSTAGWADVSSSTLDGVTNQGTLGVNNGQTLSLRKSGGSTRVDGELVASQFNLDDAVVSGSGVVTGNVIQSGGTVMPGASPGHLTIDGTYAQAAGGWLEIGLGGTSQGVTYDWLEVTGDALLNRWLRVLLFDGFFPHDGDVFTVTFASHTGEFDSGIEGLKLRPDWRLNEIWTDTSFSLQAEFTGEPGEIPEPATYVLIGGGAGKEKRGLTPISRPQAPNYR